MDAGSTKTKLNRGVAARFAVLLRRIFGGRSPGAGYVEYLLIGAFCGLGLIMTFQRFRARGNVEIRNQSRTIAAFDTPNPMQTLADLGGYEDYRENLNCNGDVCTLPNQCFAAGTVVDTEYGDRPIESIRVGDRVWSRNETTKVVGLHPVTRLFVTRDRYVVDLTLGHDALHAETVTVTPNHPFWVEGQGWTAAEALATDAAWSPEGPLSISSTFGWTETTTVYNLEVEGDHTYFVGHSHALVHNANPPASGGAGAPGTCPGRPQYTDHQWGTIGEQRGAQQAERDGLHDPFGRPWPEINPIARSSVDQFALKGIDDVRVDADGHVYIVEYKSRNAGLDPGPPPQMSEEWVERKLQEIDDWLRDPRHTPQTDPEYETIQATLDLMREALAEGRLYGRMYTTPEDPNSADSVGQPYAKKGWAYGEGAPPTPFTCNAGAPSPPCP